jgi:hypothetical protein
MEGSSRRNFSQRCEQLRASEVSKQVTADCGASMWLNLCASAAAKTPDNFMLPGVVCRGTSQEIALTDCG